MDYNLDALGSRNFEHLSQSLAVKTLGHKTIVFGDGPDGGREATWAGNVQSLGALDAWDGYGVLQAKFMLHPALPAENLQWLKDAVRTELAQWAKPGTKRERKPDFLLFVTNVRLSSVPASGKDAIDAFLRDELKKDDLGVKDFRVWDYYDLIALLDDAGDIRRRYNAFITPGDVISALLDQLDGPLTAFGQAISTFTARSLRDDNLLNLTQAGTAGDGQVTIGEVFVDLPADLPVQSWLTADGRDSASENDKEAADFESTMDEMFSMEEDTRATERSGVARHLIGDFNHIAGPRRDNTPHPHKTVLIGGPGQGKSTITQWLAQLYRAEFLRGSPVSRTTEVANIIEGVDQRRLRLELPEIASRRWPVRIVLTELADYLAREPDRSLLHYVAAKMTERSSMDVEVLMLRKWLSDYPWLVLIDGLDEVPDSSNRGAVMTVIRDFFLDVAAIGGDVAAVATTRPQGYSEEFSPSEYRHFQLQPLAVSEALGYAERLVAVRMGEGTPTARKVMSRLERASSEEPTLKLFESPLQVTILEVLLERLGKAPSDRSRLYSAYYKVISQREQEKSGALSDLLQKYESDVDYLHRQIGFELQRRSSEVGATSASLSLLEFEQLIANRFRSQGHPESDVSILSQDFSVLVTDRLVFLAKIQADRIGFELRSLQEFMAAEFIVNLREQRVIAEIQKIAPSPFWRNVVLFAIGSIFAHREHLRAEVVLLCERLNYESKAAEVILPGSDLAIDILRDGSCLSMPIYSMGLAKTAIQLLDSTQTERVMGLLFLRDIDLSPILWDGLQTSQPLSASATINRARLLSAIKVKDGDEADQILRALFADASAQLKKQLVLWSWDRSDRNVAELAATHFTMCSLDEFAWARSVHGRRALSERETPAMPEWVNNVRELVGFSRRENNDGSEQSFQTGLSVRANCHWLGSDSSVWEWLAKVSKDHEAWGHWADLSAFALGPSGKTLSRSLQSAGVETDPFVPSIAPWPYSACVEFVDSAREPGGEGRQREAFEELAAVALKGDLGAATDWLAAQERWGRNLVLDEDFVRLADNTDDRLPLSRDLRTSGLVPEAFWYTAHRISVRDEGEQVVELAKALATAERRTPFFVHLALFVASVAASQAIEGETIGVDLHGLRDLLEKQLPPEVSAPLWISWLSIAPISPDSPADATLIKIGIADRVVGSVSQSGAIQLIARAKGSQQPRALLRLALASDPTLLLSIPATTVEELQGDGESPADAIEPAFKLLTAKSVDLWSGSLDSEFDQIRSMKRVTVGATWFTSVLDDLESPLCLDVAARAALLASDSAPDLAEDWADVAWRRYLSQLPSFDIEPDSPAVA